MAHDRKITTYDVHPEEVNGKLVGLLFTADKEKAELALRKEHPRLRNTRSSNVNYNGYAHGQRDGRNATFNRALR